MHRLWMALATLLLASALPALADQRDPRLDGLFAVLQTSKDPAQAREATQRIRAIWQESPVPVAAESLAAGIRLAVAGRARDAVAAFDAAIAAAPDFAEAYARRAAIYAEAGLLIPAIADVEEALRLETRHFDAFAGLGQIDAALGDARGAEKALDQALALNPYLSDVRAALDDLKAARARREL